MGMNSTAQLLAQRKILRATERQLELQQQQAGIDTTPKTRKERRKAKVDRIGDRLFGL